MKIEEMERLATALTARLMDPWGGDAAAVKAWTEKYREVLAEFIEQNRQEFGLCAKCRTTHNSQQPCAPDGR